jgi:hypothetical protein
LEVTITTTTSRRAILAGAAMFPAVSLPALAAAEPDPIFAAIEKMKVTDAEHGRRCKGELEVIGPEYEAWYEAQGIACYAAADARDEMLATVPTTVARAVAMVDAVLASWWGETDDFYPELVQSLRTFLIGGEGGLYGAREAVQS